MQRGYPIKKIRNLPSAKSRLATRRAYFITRLQQSILFVLFPVLKHERPVSIIFQSQIKITCMKEKCTKLCESVCEIFTATLKEFKKLRKSRFVKSKCKNKKLQKLIGIQIIEINTHQEACSRSYP